MKAKSALLCLSVMVATGCADQKPPDLLAEPIYEKLLVEVRMLSEYRMATSDSLLTSRLADSIFTLYGIDPERFYRSHSWYESDPSAHAARLGRLADSLSALDTQISTPKD